MGRKLRPKEAAEYLGMSEKWIRDLLETGVIPHLKLGTARNSPVLIETDDLDALMDAYRRPATIGPLAEVEPEPAPTRGKRAS